MFSCDKIQNSKDKHKKSSNLTNKKVWLSVAKYNKKGFQNDKIDDQKTSDKTSDKKHFISSPNSSAINSQQILSSDKLTNITKRKHQKQLADKAKVFIAQIRHKKKELQGKFYLLKRAEVNKKQDLQLKKQVQQHLQKQTAKRLRRIKAQKNISFYNQKKIEGRLNSCSPKKRKQFDISCQQSQKLYKIKFPSIFTPTSLVQIKQEDSSHYLPIGLRKCIRKTHKKQNPQTIQNQQQSYRVSQTRQISSLMPQRDKSKMNSVRINRKVRQQDQNKICYLMKRQRATKTIQDYLQKFSNLNIFIEQKLTKKRFPTQQERDSSPKNLFSKEICLTQHEQGPSSLLYEDALLQQQQQQPNE